MSVAPFVQTPPDVAKKMLELSEIKKGETLYDMGCGDGRIIIMAAKEMGANSIGIELRDDLVERAKAEIIRLNLEGKVKVVRGNFFEVDVSPADVVTLYLTSSANERLKSKLESQLKPGTRIVSHDFKIAGWKPDLAFDGIMGHTIYRYIIGKHM